MEGNTVSVERVIKAPPGAIFALLADAGKHAGFDGSGSVNHAGHGRDAGADRGPARNLMQLRRLAGASARAAS